MVYCNYSSMTVAAVLIHNPDNKMMIYVIYYYDMNYIIIYSLPYQFLQ